MLLIHWCILVLGGLLAFGIFAPLAYGQNNNEVVIVPYVSSSRDFTLTHSLEEQDHLFKFNTYDSGVFHMLECNDRVFIDAFPYFQLAHDYPRTLYYPDFSGRGRTAVEQVVSSEHTPVMRGFGSAYSPVIGDSIERYTTNFPTIYNRPGTTIYHDLGLPGSTKNLDLHGRGVPSEHASNSYAQYFFYVELGTPRHSSYSQPLDITHIGRVTDLRPPSTTELPYPNNYVSGYVKGAVQGTLYAAAQSPFNNYASGYNPGAVPGVKKFVERLFPAFLGNDVRAMELIGYHTRAGNDTDAFVIRDAQRGDFLWTITNGTTAFGTGVPGTHVGITSGTFGNIVTPTVGSTFTGYDVFKYFATGIAAESSALQLSQSYPAKSVGVHYHLRPLYDVDFNQVKPSPRGEMLIPGYVFSDHREIKCDGVVLTQDIASSDIRKKTNSVTFKTNWDCDKIYALPTEKVVPIIKEFSRPDLTFEDVIHEDYCDLPDEFADRIIVHEFDTGFEPVPAFRDIIYIDKSELDSSKTHYYTQLKINDTASPGFSFYDSGSVSGTCTAQDQVESWNFAYRPFSDLSSSQKMADKSAGIIQPVSNNTVAGGYAPYKAPLSHPTTVKCDIVLHSNGEDIDASFTSIVPAPVPAYSLIISDLDTNLWGWGTGTPAGAGDSFGFSLMGTSFVTVMVLLTSMVGFNRRHIPSAVIVYVSVLGIFNALGVVTLSESVFSVILLVAMLAIFSKGFK